MQPQHYQGIRTNEAAVVGVQTAVNVGTAVATGATGTVVGASTISGWLAAAGVSASVPVVGWVIAGGIALVGTIFSFASHAKRKGIMTHQVVELAKLYGIPQVASDPGWVIDAINWGYHQRKREAEKLESKISKGKGKEWENRTKLSFLGVLELQDLMDRRRAAGLRPIPVSQAEVQSMVLRVQQESTGIAKAYQTRRLGMVLIGAGVLVLVLVAQRQS